jgi:hypothetical protein
MYEESNPLVTGCWEQCRDFLRQRRGARRLEAPLRHLNDVDQELLIPLRNFSFLLQTVPILADNGIDLKTRRIKEKVPHKNAPETGGPGEGRGVTDF